MLISDVQQIGKYLVIAMAPLLQEMYVSIYKFFSIFIEFQIINL